MRTKKHPIKTALASLFVACLFGFSPVNAETAESSKDGHTAQHSMDWPGIYNGFTPCDDCIGIKTSLALNQNNSYILITQNVGKSPREFVEKGKFAWTEQDNTIILTPKNGTTTRQYLVGEDTLTTLDSNGELFIAKQAERYVLHRKGLSEPAADSHSGH